MPPPEFDHVHSAHCPALRKSESKNNQKSDGTPLSTDSRQARLSTQARAVFRPGYCGCEQADAVFIICDILCNVTTPSTIGSQLQLFGMEL